MWFPNKVTSMMQFHCKKNCLPLCKYKSTIHSVQYFIIKTMEPHQSNLKKVLTIKKVIFKWWDRIKSYTILKQFEAQ